MTDRTKWIASTILALAIATAARAQSDARKEIYDTDAKFRLAMIHGDAGLLGHIVADDAKIIHGNRGGVQDKAGLIASFRRYHIDAYDRLPILLKIEGDIAVLVSTTRKVAGHNTTVTSTTEVFVRRSGEWQILILQNTDHASG